MKLVDALTLTLRGWGVRYVFGVSGANIEHLHDAIHRLGGNELRSVMSKSEVGAAFMADSRARVHRTLGVCCATSGGAMMNLAVGVAESYAESVPVLALVGQVPGALVGLGAFQDSSGIGRTVDALALFRQISKYAARIDSAERFWEQLHAAVETALSGRPGPAVLLFPRDIYEIDVGERPSWLPATLAEMRRPVVARESDVRALLSALGEARRPVLVIGTGVARSAEPEAVAAFALAARIPVVTTMASPGAFPNDDPLFLGAIGAAGHPSANAYLNERADLVVAVGTSMDVMTRHPLGEGLARVRVAIVNVDPAQAMRSVAPNLVVEGDAGLVFRALAAMWNEMPFVHEPPADYELTRYRPKLLDPGQPTHVVDTELLQSQAIRVVEAFLPESGHLLFDAGNCAVAALHGLQVPRAVTTTIALGMGGMGYAIAGAIGAQLGDDARRTIVMCGDGAFLMHGLEIHTAVELGLPILFCVFNDRKHGMCVTRQKLYFGGRVECSTYAEIGIAEIARGLGPDERLWVGRAATRAELSGRLAEYGAVSVSRPGVLEICLARDELPAFTPFLEPNAATYVVRKAEGHLRERPAA